MLFQKPHIENQKKRNLFDMSFQIEFEKFEDN